MLKLTWGPGQSIYPDRVRFAGPLLNHSCLLQLFLLLNIPDRAGFGSFLD